MTESTPSHDNELAAIAASGAIFSKLPDTDARRRVLSYVLARYLPEAAPVHGQPPPSPLPAPGPASGIRSVERPECELPGVARLTDTGELQMTLRELQARSRLEAVVRLATVAIYAHQRLTGQPLSSRRLLTPLLKEWRLYDGNTRSRLAREPGIIRNGDNLSLDSPARRNAERFVNDIHSTVDVGKRAQRFHRWDSEPITKHSTGSAKAAMRGTFDHIENWDNFTNKCSIGIHTVNEDGTILWANRTELDFLGYEPDEYIGHFIGDFHLDEDDVHDVLGMLTRFETVHNFPARMRAKDGSIRFVMVNSNVYRHAGGEFGHSRCFTTEIDEAMWKALKGRPTLEEGGTS